MLNALNVDRWLTLGSGSVAFGHEVELLVHLSLS